MENINVLFKCMSVLVQFEANFEKQFEPIESVWTFKIWDTLWKFWSSLWVGTWEACGPRWCTLLNFYAVVSNECLFFWKAKFPLDLDLTKSVWIFGTGIKTRQPKLSTNESLASCRLSAIYLLILKIMFRNPAALLPAEKMCEKSASWKRSCYYLEVCVFFPAW